MLTVEELKDILNYNEKTGLFYWKCSGSGRSFGRPAGYISPRGYIYITIKGKSYSAHRLAWLYVTGNWSTAKEIDHIDGCPDNNSFENLREATTSQNSHWGNMHRRKDDKLSRYIGVTYARYRKKAWQASIQVNGTVHFLGRFFTEEEAAGAYNVAAKTYFGDFAFQQEIVVVD